MSSHRFRSEAGQRSAERMAREDAAPRLTATIPGLQTLVLEIAEFRSEGSEPLVRHTRHVVVQRAPAMFRFPCGDTDCDGQHDLTPELLRSLRKGHTEFSGEVVCRGQLRTTDCRRRFTYVARAGYAAAADSRPADGHRPEAS